MKIAIPRYMNRIAPRFGFMEDILVLEVENERINAREIISMDRYMPYDIPELLAQKGVDVVLTGGIGLHFQNLFRSWGIEVIWGLIGTPEEALDAFLSGQIFPGMGRCPLRGRRRRHRRGPFWN